MANTLATGVGLTTLIWVFNGEVLLFRVEQQRLGKTSVTYKISVFGTVICPEPEKVLFSTNMTFVNVYASDNKQAI